MDALLVSLMPPESVYAVGGRVRDELRAENLGLPFIAKDADYVVVGVDDVDARLATAGRVDRVGASFAVYKFTVDGNTVDVALPRRERSTGVGHRDFTVESGADIPLTDDLARRDFRMNMIARALPSGDLVDPYNGASDIAARRIDILTPVTFEEDPLRLLRACQFAARFGYTPSDVTLRAMQDSAALVQTVSPERVHDELVKLLSLADKPSIGIELMRVTGLLAHVWPEFLEGYGMEQNEWHAFDVYHHLLVSLDATPPGDVVLRLAALFHDVGKPRVKDGPHFYRHEHVGAEMTRDMLSRLRFSNDTIDTVSDLVRHHMYCADPDVSESAIRRFIRRVRPDRLARLFSVREADIVGSGLPRRDDSNQRFEARVDAVLSAQPAFSVKDLSVNGNDVIAALETVGSSINPGGGRRVGEILHELFEHVTDHPQDNNRSTLLKLLLQLAQKPSNREAS